MPNNKNIPGYVFKGKRVLVVHSDKNAYQELVGEEGLVEVAGSGSSIGVRLDYHTNSASSKGLYWFSKHELKIIDEEYLREKEVKGFMNRPEGYQFIAKVVLVRTSGFTNKEYEYALYTEDYLMLTRDNGVVRPDQLVVVPSTGSNRESFMLAKIIEVYEAPVLEEGQKESRHPYAEVVGVVCKERYNRKLSKIQKEKEIAEIQKRLDAEIDKLSQQQKNSSYYRKQIDTMFPGNETLTALLDQMKELERGL